jgi:hypothetical protein
MIFLGLWTTMKSGLKMMRGERFYESFSFRHEPLAASVA